MQHATVFSAYQFITQFKLIGKSGIILGVKLQLNKYYFNHIITDSALGL